MAAEQRVSTVRGNPGHYLPESHHGSDKHSNLSDRQTWNMSWRWIQLVTHTLSPEHKCKKPSPKHGDCLINACKERSNDLICLSATPKLSWCTECYIRQKITLKISPRNIVANREKWTFYALPYLGLQSWRPTSLRPNFIKCTHIWVTIKWGLVGQGHVLYNMIY